MLVEFHMQSHPLTVMDLILIIPNLVPRAYKASTMVIIGDVEGEP